MRMRRSLLAGFAVLSIVHGAGVLFGSPLLPSAAVLAWAVLLGYALLPAPAPAPAADAVRPAPGDGARPAPADGARPAAPAGRIRLALLAGPLAFGALALLDVLAPGDPWTGTEGASFQYLSIEEVAASWFDRYVREAVALLVGYGALAYAVLAAPARGSARRAAVGAAIGGGGALGYLLLDLAARGWEPRWNLPLVLGLPVLVGSFAVAGAALARRGGVLPAAGAVLLALTTLPWLDRLLAWSALYAPHPSEPGAYLSAVVLAAPGPAVSLGECVAVLARLAGAAAVVVGASRAAGRPWVRT
ncbi:hypothetical protein AB0J86_05995 [Micromonospora sp. NPDC049559]|uniref:hypothetical protein n=1 Tax=Micromonospora sp. NPDC049559 TaxID=3155923 RepID=UPI00341822F6